MKVAICTPVYDVVTAQYTRSLADMLVFTSKCTVLFNGTPLIPDVKLIMNSGTLLPMVRTWLVEDALAWGANYILWIDADHLFPENSLLRLLSLNLPVVGGNYARRMKPGNPNGPTADGLDGQPVYTTEDAARNNEIIEVSTLGLGFCLVDVNVIHRLREPVDGLRRPLFALGMTHDFSEFVGEDVYFFSRVREAGYSIYVDQALSWDIGHVGRSILRHPHTLQDRDAYLARLAKKRALKGE